MSGLHRLGGYRQKLLSERVRINLARNLVENESSA
jgi:hypothetical protein